MQFTFKDGLRPLWILATIQLTIIAQFQPFDGVNCRQTNWKRGDHRQVKYLIKDASRQQADQKRHDEFMKLLTSEDIEQIGHMEQSFEAALGASGKLSAKETLEKLGLSDDLLAKELGPPNRDQESPEMSSEEGGPMTEDNGAGGQDDPLHVAANHELLSDHDDEEDDLGEGFVMVEAEQANVAEGEPASGQQQVQPKSMANPLNICMKCYNIFSSLGRRISNAIDGKIMKAKASILMAARFLRWYTQYSHMDDQERQTVHMSVSMNLSILNTLRVTYAQADFHLEKIECPEKPQECDNFPYVMRVMEKTINDLESDLRLFEEEKKQTMNSANEPATTGDDDGSQDEDESLMEVSGPEIDVGRSMMRLRRVMWAISKRRLKTELQIVTNLTVQAAVFWAIGSAMTNIFGLDQDVQLKFINIAKLLVQTDFRNIAPNYWSGIRMRPIIQLFASFFS